MKSPSIARGRMFPRPVLMAIAVVLLALVTEPRPSTAGALDEMCVVGVRPAATLLFPYFHVDLDDANGLTTLISITNTSSNPTLAHVVLWTDWALSTLAFDVYLAGNDVQAIDLRRILVGGLLPSTGPAVSNHGSLSGPRIHFPNCNNGSTPGMGPNHGNPVLLGTELAAVQKWHTGRESMGSCWSSPRSDSSYASGYITVDVVNQCTKNTPEDLGYFGLGGIASLDNVLMGDYYFVNPSENFAQGEPAVHVIADTSFNGSPIFPPVSTFYGRYVNYQGTDFRVPLSSRFGIRFLNGGGFTGGTKLIVWREAGGGSMPMPVACGSTPWPALSDVIQSCDETSECTLPVSSSSFPWATQIVAVSSLTTDDFGWLFLNLDDGASAGLPGRRQAWVLAVLDADGRYSVAVPALRFDGCQ